jgi:putative exporter of polyketide antibiotics
MQSLLSKPTVPVAPHSQSWISSLSWWFMFCSLVKRPWLRLYVGLAECVIKCCVHKSLLKMRYRSSARIVSRGRRGSAVPADDRGSHGSAISTGDSGSCSIAL